MAAEAVVDAPTTEAPTTEAPAPPPPAKPKKAPAAPKGDAGKKAGKKGKGDDAKKGKGAAVSTDRPSVAGYPRAVRSIARAKSWGGLLGFVLGGYLALPTNTLAGAGLRALVAGIVCYVAVWAGAVFLWRRLIVLEIKGREQQALDAVLAARGAHEQAPAGERAGAKASP